MGKGNKPNDQITSHTLSLPVLVQLLPSEWSLLRTICCYMNKGRNWSGLFVRERAQLSFELLGGDLIHDFIKLMYIYATCTRKMAVMWRNVIDRFDDVNATALWYTHKPLQE